MTIARRQLIDVSVSRWYHCMSRCVRGASLLCDGPSNRKEWIENRIEELAQIFALGVGGFSVMDNIEDRRRFDSPREGMFEGLSIGTYLLDGELGMVAAGRRAWLTGQRACGEV